MNEYLNLSIQYKAKVNILKRTIKNMHENGFNTTKYEKNLMDIIQEVDEKRKSGNILLQGNLQVGYIKAITNLNILITNLEELNQYFMIIGYCNWVENRLTTEISNREKITSYVSDMIKCLDKFANIKVFDIENEHHVINKIYKLTYDLIKYELVLTGNSELYNYIKLTDIHTPFINELIYNEIKESNLDKYNSLIKDKIYELHINIDGNDYFDLELIKLLISAKHEEKLKAAADLSIGNIKEVLIDSNDELKKASQEYHKKQYKFTEQKKDLKYNKKEFRKKFIAVSLALSLIIGGGVGVERLVRNMTTTDRYIATTEEYSSESDTTEFQTKTRYLYKEPSPKIIARIYKPSDNEKLYYDEYDISTISYETAKEYYEQITEFLDYEATNGYIYDKNSHKGEFTTISKTTYAHDGIGLDTTAYILRLILLYLLYSIIIFLIDVFRADIANNNYLLIDYLYELVREDISDIRDDKKALTELLKTIKIETDKLLELINQNESYRQQFYELYNANKYLLDNPEELEKKINEVINDNKIDEIKKLTKEKLQ